MSTILTGSVGDQVYTMTWTGSALEGAPANIQAWLDAEVGPGASLEAISAALPRLFGDTLVLTDVGAERPEEDSALAPLAPDPAQVPPAPGG